MLLRHLSRQRFFCLGIASIRREPCLCFPAAGNEALIGKTLPLKFLEVNSADNKLVVSQRRAVVEGAMQTMAKGDVLLGTVAALKPYGAFVDINGMSGLLHVSQISHDRVESVPAVLAEGMPVKVMIVDRDHVNGRIALSTEPAHDVAQVLTASNASSTNDETKRMTSHSSSRRAHSGADESIGRLGVTW